MRNLRLLAVFASLALLSTALFPFLYWVPKVLDCRTDSDPSTYLAYCNSKHFGDYEHAAFFWGLEPRVVESLRAAKVLFVGNSRVQFAFSTEATRHTFKEMHLPHYLAGFGYVENMTFIQQLIKKYGLHPEAVVINADYSFFKNEMTPISIPFFEPVTRSAYWAALYNNLLKAGFSRVARSLCGYLTGACPQTLRTLWRRPETGEWVWLGTFAMKDESIPVDPAKAQPPPDEPAMENILQAATAFVADLRLPSRCVILTAIPNNVAIDEPIANRVGERLQLPVIVPHLDHLATIDNDHLDGPSAERWSGAFFRDAIPALDRCLAK